MISGAHKWIQSASSVLVAFSLGACASTVALSNSRGGIIQAGFTPNGWQTAFRIADAECHKYGRVAVVQSKNLIDNTMRYECAAP